MAVSKSRLRNLAVLLALPVSAIGGLSLVTDNFTDIVAHGPIQQGHLEVDCSGCHTKGEGSVRQQLQANVKFALGMRATGVNFGYQPVTSDHCLACHERPNERHPIYRFNEPRFSQARQQIAVNSCVGCHSEHGDERVSINETFCSHCHDDLLLKNDPLDVSHADLVVDEAWGSCMGCHDFHGNHPHEPQTRIRDAFQVEVVRDYFKNGLDPFGGPKLYEAKSDE